MTNTQRRVLRHALLTALAALLLPGQDANTEIETMRTSKPGPYYIIEDTRSEAVAEGSDGRIVRWARNNGAEQQWNLEKAASGYRLRNVKSGKYVSMAWNGGYWAGTEAATLNFSRSDAAGKYKIVESTKSEYFSVGSNGWLVRWAWTGQPGQKFNFVPVNAPAAVTPPTTAPPATPAGPVTTAQMIAAINLKRQSAQVCGGVTYPAVPPLRENATLNNAAQLIINDRAHSSAALRYVGNAGYVSWGAAAVSTLDVIDAIGKPAAPNVVDMPDPMVPSITLKAAPTAWMGSPATCRAIMTAYSEAGMAVKGSNLMFVMAEPYVTADQGNYLTRMFNELNRIRRQGINASLYPGAQCSSGPVPALQWNDKFAAAGQFHSDDYARNGVVNGADNSPHTGTAGDSPQSRIVAQGCSNASAGENVVFNGFLNPEQAVRTWITMSAGHCQGLMSSAVGGFGLSASFKLNAYPDGPVGPFVTYTHGTPGSCSGSSRAAR